MRSLVLLACLGFSAVGLAACTSRSGIDSLGFANLRPSKETTSAIPRPNAPVAESVAAAPAGIVTINDEVAALADAGMPPVVPSALVGNTEARAVEAAQQVALAIPDKPSAVRAAIGGPIQRHRFRDAKPINFGKVAPKDYAVHGVDVSRWQGDIDWVKLRSQGANFAYIKATDGGDHLDPMFRKNWRGAQAAGLKRGAYHFFYWCRTASEQADWFIRNVPKVEGALPPVIDVEYNGQSSCKRRLPRAKIIEKMQVFMDRLEAHYGQRPIIYTAPDFYEDNLKGEFKNYPFWLRSVAAHPSKRYPGRDWVLWQYSGSGLSHGVEGKIDLNVFNGSEKQWWAWLSGATAVAAR